MGKSFVLSSLCAALLVTACNDSNATAQDTKSAPAAASTQDSVALVTSSSDINRRNHVCFTMDVNNVKCVLGDTVAYVPQPILDEQKADQNKGKGKKDKKEDAAEKEAQAQLMANQNALNEAVLWYLLPSTVT